MDSYVKHVAIRLKGAAYKKLQLEVMERDNWTCQECGRWTQSPPHHRVYLSQGGSDIESNLITLCRDCHRLVHDAKIKLPQGAK